MEQLPAELRAHLPDPEPTPPATGFSVRVARPFIAPGAKERVAKTVEDGLVSSATSVLDEFEEELRKEFGVPFAKACSSGYSALVTALRLADVCEGCEVLVPSLTMIAVLNAVYDVNATPVFVDCAPGELNPSVDEYSAKRTRKTAALIVTHTYGVPANIAEIQAFCGGHRLVLIEDIAEAIGTEFCGKLAGTFGDFACASLYANKAITSGDGGFILSTRKDERLRERADSLVNHGFTKHYHFVHLERCGNHKMSGLQAALATPAVSQISSVMEDRYRISQKYRSELQCVVPQLTPMPVNKWGKDTPWVFGVLADSKETRRRLRQTLADAGYETRDFFLPLHLQPLYLLSGGKLESLPHCEDMGRRGFYLPTFFGMSDQLIEDICKCLESGLASC